MSQQDNFAIVREIYDAVGRGDVIAIVDRVSAPAHPALPFPGSLPSSSA